jgi:hypothetical protein
MNRIQVSLLIPVPKKLVVTIPGDNPGELPKEMKLVQWGPEFHVRVIQGLKVGLGQGKEQNHPVYTNERFCFFRLTFYVENTDFHAAIDVARPVIESIFDSLSFQTQQALLPLSLELLDVSPPLSLNDQRDNLNIGNPETMLLYKFFQFPSLQIPTDYLPILGNVDVIENKSDQIALWWYIKSLSTPFLIERLSFFTTIIDIISKPHKVGPYKTNCGHEIAVCPTPGCGKSIERPLVGDSVKEFLMANGFSNEEANKLWKIRQIVHGKDLFSFPSLDEASVLVNKLQIIIFNYLTSKIKVENFFPTVDINAVLPMPHNIMLTGYRNIVESDMEIAGAFENLTQ